MAAFRDAVTYPYRKAGSETNRVISHIFRGMEMVVMVGSVGSE
jgi:hypothetical protein